MAGAVSVEEGAGYGAMESVKCSLQAIHSVLVLTSTCQLQRMVNVIKGFNFKNWSTHLGNQIPPLREPNP